MSINASLVKRTLTNSFYGLTAVLALSLAACAGPQALATTAHAQAPSADHYGVEALNGYQVSLFASGTKDYFNPDAVEVSDGHVFIDYQNKTAKDGTDNKTSTIVEYTMDGKVLKKFSAPGHSDGMRVNPVTKQLWVTSNEDGNPKFETIDPVKGTVTPYTFSPTPHGGGYDDVYFLNGSAFIAASNPTLDKNGVNVFPAVDKIQLDKGKVVLTPILMGNAQATDITAGATTTKVTLNEIDPDSLSTDHKGNLVLINQAGSEIVYIGHPGTAQQAVSRLTVGTQLDDTVWPNDTDGRLLVVDGPANHTYWVRGHFKAGSIYTETPSDSGVAGVLATVDKSTGILSPVAIGFTSPTGMIFVPDHDQNNNN
ncbi:hypothetical protein [Dictyobacter kobayashii]|uniref:Lipoprotein n=1 Tax=Dictyobacter kobayashii TaxID=2014872 RepID=A0A402AEH1_9CHLR|nr:hypothetical protein [Dictyobacter kobayashii]GCE17491.1 hypothetical protein KDK_12910 [Dictyobacter kobayashii]